jgi:cell division septum initiation protein DivIVA
MPDENSAAREHAIMQEITAPLSTLPDNPVPAVSDVEFPIVLRGYDRLAVDAYVKRTSQLVAELQSTRSPEAAVRRALERVGEEVAGILQRAHEAASQITTQSRSEAEDRLERARREAAEITAAAKLRLKDLDAETDRIWGERHRIVEDAQDLARQLLALADSAAERFPAADEPAEEEPLGDPAAGEEPLGDPAAGEEEPLGDPAAGPQPPTEPAAGPQPFSEPTPAEAPLEARPLPDAEEEPAVSPVFGGDAGAEPPDDVWDDDTTRVMPPIRPDEHQRGS